MMGAPVVVSGATGFVGRATCARLAASGIPVRALTRDGSSVEGAEAQRLGGLDDLDGLQRAVAGADAVVHSAARVHVMRDTAADPLAEFRRVNVEGTRNLALAAARAGVRRFVLVSSVKALGEGGEAPLTPDTPPRPVDPYGISKLEAEREVAAIGRETGMEVVVVRLPVVYGPGMKGNMLSLLRLVDRGVPIPLGSVRNRRSVVFVENVAELLRLAVVHPGAAGGTFHASEGEPLATPDLVRLMAGALGRPARLVPVPVAWMRIAGRVGDALRLPLRSTAVDRLVGSLWVSGGDLWKEAGRPPLVTPEEGMSRTARWYRSR